MTSSLFPRGPVWLSKVVNVLKVAGLIAAVVVPLSVFAKDSDVARLDKRVDIETVTRAREREQYDKRLRYIEADHKAHRAILERVEKKLDRLISYQESQAKYGPRGAWRRQDPPLREE